MFPSDKNNPLWFKQREVPHFEPLQEDLQSDITIIGAGITGMTLAYLLSKQNVDVTVIDAGKIFSSTTGHTTAKVTAQHGLIYDNLLKNFGEEYAQMYYDANKDALQFIKNTIEENDIDAQFQQKQSFVYTKDESKIKKLEDEYKAYEKLNIKGNFLNHSPLETLNVKAILQMKDQAQFHPIKYLNALTSICLKRNVNFYENTTVVSIDNESDQKVSIKTYNGQKVKSDYVVVASHYPLEQLKNLYFARLQANRSYVVATRVKRKEPLDMYISYEQPTRSIRSLFNEDGEQIVLITGEDHKTGVEKSEEENKYKTLLNFSHKHFQTKDRNLVAYWATQDIMTIDGVPYIGKLTKDKSNVLVATGYNKWGMTQSAVAAKELLSHINKGEAKYEKLYNPSRNLNKEGFKGISKYTFEAAVEMVTGKLSFDTDKRINIESLNNLQKNEAVTTYYKGLRLGAYKDDNNKIHIVDTTCTHLRCETNWNADEKSWDCPCHGSRFSFTGDVIHGPATKPLRKIKFDDK